MQTNRILLIDTNQLLKNKSSFLSFFGFKCYKYSNWLFALNSVETIDPGIILFFWKGTENELDDFLSGFKKVNKNIQCIIISKSDSIKQATHAVKNGAFAFLTYPFSNKRLVKILEDAKKQMILSNVL